MKTLYESLYGQAPFIGEQVVQNAAMAVCISACAQTKRLLVLNTTIQNKLAILNALTESKPMQSNEPQALIESMHPLVTPEFTGTHEEMITAINFWVSLVSQLRSLPSVVTTYENREAIITQVEQEIAGLRSELQNVSTTVTTSADGMPSMVQPKTNPDGEPEPEADQTPVVDLSVSEDMQRLAGIAPKRNSLSDAFKRLG